MDYKKELVDLQSCLKNFNKNVASELLSDTNFITNNFEDILHLFGSGLTENDFKSRPDYFYFCEGQLLKMAQTEAHQEKIFDFLELLDLENCKLSSSVLIVVTVLEKTESPNPVGLEYLLTSTFNNLKEMDDSHLIEILPGIIEHLIKLNKHFQNEPSLLYYFARVAFLVLRAKIDPVKYLKILSNIINDPFFLLEHEFEEIEENLYLASFFYLYFKSEILWGPKVYNRLYILEKCSHLALSVFEDNNFGKSFTKLILTKFKDNEIPLYFLNKRHENFFMEAALSALYNDNVNVRKESIESLMMYIDKLCSDAQYIVFKYAFFKFINSCIKAQLIIKMKDLLLLKLRLNKELGYFQGLRLLELVKLCTNITNGSKCQVVENKEHILAAISLMCILCGYNGENLNMDSGFSIYVKQFVEIVQNAIDYTNEQFKFESEQLDSEDHKEKDIMDLPKLSKSETLKLLSHNNTVTKLLQSSLDMLKEFIKD